MATATGECGASGRDMSDATASYYDQYWSAEGFRPTEAVDGRFRRLLNDQIDGSSRVLDLGCGDGTSNGVWLASWVASYCGADVSEPAIEQARALGLRAELIEDAGLLPFGNREFDVVVLAEVLEHLFAPQAALREARRVLAPGGLVVASVPNCAYWRRRADLALLGRWNPLGDELSVSQPWRDPHIRFFTRGALRRLCLETGFGVREQGGYGGTLTGELPVVRDLVRPSGHTHPDWRPHPAYAVLEQLLPGLFGFRLYVVARAPE
jgi:methionine biosynthesis protein MetW